MQVRPGTARDIVRWEGAVAALGDLKTPAVNMDLGQRYLQYLSREPATGGQLPKVIAAYNAGPAPVARSEEHTSELQSLMRISYAVFCLKKKKKKNKMNVTTR